MTPELAQRAIKQRFAKSDIQPIIRSGATLYKVRYRSTDVKGNPVTLSGLVVFPDQKIPLGMIVYMHGTTSVYKDVPSNCGPGSVWSPESWNAVLAYATGGYEMVAPDYLGLGDNPGVHPYAMGRANAVSAIDLLSAAKELRSKLNRVPGRRLLVTGYSEGGGLAMWLTRILEESKDPDHVVTMAAPVSGPYDLSGAQTDAILANQSSLLDVVLRAYFIAYFGLSLEKVYDVVNLDQVFVPSFASYIPIVFARQGENETVKQLGIKALELGAFTSIKRLLTPATYSFLRNRTASNPIVEKLLENDCTAWTPRAPLFLLGLRADNVVVFQNTINTVKAMRKLGVGADRLNFHGVTQKGLNHLNATAPLFAIVRKFFDRGYPGVSCDPDPSP